MIRRLLAIILPLLLILSGCSKDPYTASMQASLTVSDAVAQAIPIIQQLQASNLLTSSEAKEVYTYLETVTLGNTVFRHTAESMHKSGQKGADAYLLAADTFVKGVNSQQALAAIHISNPKSQAKVMLYLNAVDTVLTGIATIINTGNVKPAPAPTPAASVSFHINHDPYVRI